MADIHLLDEREMGRMFPGCELGAEPPFGRLYGIPLIVDTCFAEEDVIALRAGSHDQCLVMHFADFAELERPAIANIGATRELLGALRERLTAIVGAAQRETVQPGGVDARAVRALQRRQLDAHVLQPAPRGPQAELEGMIEQLESMLEPKGFFRPEDRRPHTRRTLRSLLTKPGWNHLEVRTMRGVLSHLAKPDRD